MVIELLKAFCKYPSTALVQRNMANKVGNRQRMVRGCNGLAILQLGLHYFNFYFLFTLDRGRFGFSNSMVK